MKPIVLFPVLLTALHVAYAAGAARSRPPMDVRAEIAKRGCVEGPNAVTNGDFHDWPS